MQTSEINKVKGEKLHFIFSHDFHLKITYQYIQKSIVLYSNLSLNTFLPPAPTNFKYCDC